MERRLTNLFLESIGGFESRDTMFGNNNCGVLGNVTRGFFRTSFKDKTTKQLP